MAERVLIVASGGGHTGFAVALAQRLQGKAEMLFVIPKGDQWSRMKVEPFGEVVEVTKGRGPKDPLWLFAARLVKASFESLVKVPGEFDVVVSTGSNHSIMPALAGKLKGMKLVNIESGDRFVKPGRAVRILAPFSDLIALQWPEQLEILPKGKVFGPIVEYPEYEPYDGGYILVAAGTYGHKPLVEAVNETSWENVVLQVGSLDPEKYRKKHPSWTVFQFDPNFGKWLAGAKVVISHPSKTVIDAAVAYRKPVVIAPNPEWRLAAGIEDGRVLAEKLNGVLVEEITPENLADAVEKVMKRKPPEYPDGAQRLAEEILKEL